MNAELRELSPAFRKFFGQAPWLLLAVTAILGVTITVLSVKNTQREKKHMTQNMINRAEALIWALEAGTRTWMGMRSTDPGLLQSLVEETAQQPGIIFIAVTDGEGRILAHNDPAQVGGGFTGEPPPTQEVNETTWRLRESAGKNVFEVFRYFVPQTSMRKGHHRDFFDCFGRHGGPPAWKNREQAASPAPAIVFVGLDRQPFEEALDENFRTNILTAVLIAFIGLAGFVSLFWAHNYRQSRRMLRNSLAMSSEVVKNLPLGLLTSEPGGKVSIINPTALAMFNLSEEVAADIPLQRLPGLDWEGITMELTQKEKLLEREMTLNVAGSPFISLTAAIMKNEDGTFLGNLFILRDITEMRRLHAEMQRNDRLAALGRLASGVAHEIRNPLSTIKGVAMYMAKRMPPGGREEEAANRMIDEVGRLDRVVSELLEFARPRTVTISEKNMRDVIAHALQLVEADIRAKQITVSVSHKHEPPVAFIDPERFTQVLLNLFLNAIQAMNSGGELRVTTQFLPENGSLRLTVSDTGPGIPEERRSAVFTPYFTTKAKGTGLGLAIVSQIVENHGGTITVDNLPDSGAEFTIILPQKAEHKE
ncbi:MAG: histidine kinase [Desulfovibrio sp.]|nr:histidine kinase [Desulfovibrio sp.]